MQDKECYRPLSVLYIIYLHIVLGYDISSYTLNIIPPIALFNIIPPISLLHIVALISYLNYTKFLQYLYRIIKIQNDVELI